MPVTFKPLPQHSAPTGESTPAYLKGKVIDLLQAPEDCDVKVGMSETTVSRGLVRIVLPFGMAHVKTGSPKMDEARQTLLAMFSGTAPSGMNLSAPANGKPAIQPYDDMTDEQWVEHTAANMFPGTLHLYQADDLYQSVLGTSGGSVYKTCFIGPHLKVAARVMKNKVSFRATTDHDTCPEGDLKAVFMRLGVSSEYDNRLTCHAQMGGPYDHAHAHEYRALFGAFYAALKPWITSNFPAIGKLAEGVK